MNLSRRIRVQLVVFAVVASVAALVMVFGYIKLPAMFGVGRYNVTLELPQSGGLYPGGNVTYRGTQVGKVKSVTLVGGGHVQAVLALSSDVKIPSNLKAEVHSQSAIGEQYVALLPRDATSAPLKAGDTITLANTSVPPPIDTVLDAASRGLAAIPQDNLKTAVDESYVAFGGLGPELARLVKGSTTLAIDAKANLGALTTLIDGSAPVLNSQADTADDIRAWAAHLADVTKGLSANDNTVAGLLDNGGQAAEEARQLIERVRPTLPVILANMVSINRVAVDYQNDIEQLLVLIPQGIAMVGAGSIANLNNPNPYAGGFLDFKLNLNLPPPCTTGYLPASQRRPPELTDAPDRPEGLLYCRVPQDSPRAVRGARNLPCETRPGKRAPTVALCESDENYVPLNDGWNWKGDPNATDSGQDIPQLPPGAPPRTPIPDAAPPQDATTSPPPNPALAVADYDPATGSYLAPDGKIYTQTDLAAGAPKEKTWQAMLLPPTR